MSKAKEYYEKAKHQDSWSVDVAYPNTVEKIIEISKIEGVLHGLKLCKEMHEKGTIYKSKIEKQEEHYKKQLKILTEE